MADGDDLRTIVREFRASVTLDVAEIRRRLDGLEAQMLDMHSTVIKELRAFGQRFDSMAARMDSYDRRFDDLDDWRGRTDVRLDGIESRLGRLEGRSNGSSPPGQ